MAAPEGGPPPAQPLRVICGPTAAGKTSLAMALADRFPVTVISADSRQIYRRFDIGTGKPTREELARLPHRGIDVVEPDTRYSAAAFAAQSQRWIADATATARVPVIVGGTGFYIRALLNPLFSEPPLDATQRAGLEKHLRSVDTEELRRWCAQLDPARSHLGRTQLLRAVEIALLTGRRLSDLHAAAPGAPPARRTARYLLVDAGPALAARMEQRVDAMFRAGWVDEVRGLVRDVPADAPAWRACGYGAVREAALGELSVEKAREAVIIATRQYAKRQRTWFRHQLAAHEVTTLDSTAPDALDRAVAWWTTREETGG